MPRTRSSSPVLASDGSDLAAAIRTIQEVGDADALDAIIDDAFPGSRIEVIETEGRFELSIRQRGLLRVLRTAEVSDGTLRFLLLVAALMTPRPPSLMVMNEPETGLHPSLLAPLASLIVLASRKGQIIVVSHSDALVGALVGRDDSLAVHLEKELGETHAPGHERPGWTWPDR